MKILIVEDEEFNQMVILEMIGLILPHVELILANNGQEALHKIHEHQFDLILSDIGMPIMDGQELAHQIRTSLNLTTPLVCVSAFAVTGDREKFLMAGFDDYISKPIDFHELKRILEKYISA